MVEDHETHSLQITLPEKFHEGTHEIWNSSEGVFNLALKITLIHSKF